MTYASTAKNMHFVDIESARLALDDIAFRQWATEQACDAYRMSIRKNKETEFRYKLWNSSWDSDYVNLLIKQGRSHAKTADNICHLLNHLGYTKLLEIGCGNGVFAAEVAKRGMNVTASEISETSLDIARWVAFGRGVDIQQNLHFILAPAEKLPFEDGSFECIWSDQTLEHVESMVSMFSEIKRVLKPGGVFFVRCPNYLRLKTKEPHFGTRWPPFMPDFVYKMLLKKDYTRRAQMLHEPEKHMAIEFALRDLYREMKFLNYVKPYQVARILNAFQDIDWMFVRAPFSHAKRRFLQPLKRFYYALYGDVAFSGSIFVMGTKKSTLDQELKMQVSRLFFDNI